MANVATTKYAAAKPRHVRGLLRYMPRTCGLCHKPKNMYEFKLMRGVEGQRSWYCTRCTRQYEQAAVVYKTDAGQQVVYDTCYDTVQAKEVMANCIIDHGREARVRTVYDLVFPPENIK